MIDLLEPAITSPYLLRGQIFHELMASLLAGTSPDEVMEECSALCGKARAGYLGDPNKLETQLTPIAAMVHGLVENGTFLDTAEPTTWKSKPAIEVEFVVSNEGAGFTLRGRFDALAILLSNELWLVEHKTTSQLSDAYVNHLDIDGQATTYIWALQQLGKPVKGVLYNIVRTPSIRQKKNESFQVFAQRLFDDYTERPSFYYTTVQVRRNKRELKEFEIELSWIAAQIRRCMETNIWPKNEFSCMGHSGPRCEFLPLCLGQPGMENLFRKRGTLHPELKQA